MGRSAQAIIPCARPARDQAAVLLDSTRGIDFRLRDQGDPGGGSTSGHESRRRARTPRQSLRGWFADAVQWHLQVVTRACAHMVACRWPQDPPLLAPARDVVFSEYFHARS